MTIISRHLVSLRGCIASSKKVNFIFYFSLLKRLPLSPPGKFLNSSLTYILLLLQSWLAYSSRSHSSFWPYVPYNLSRTGSTRLRNCDRSYRQKKAEALSPVSRHSPSTWCPLSAQASPCQRLVIQSRSLYRRHSPGALSRSWSSPAPSIFDFSS
jgi:hypothetical protein